MGIERRSCRSALGLGCPTPRTSTAPPIFGGIGGRIYTRLHLLFNLAANTHMTDKSISHITRKNPIVISLVQTPQGYSVLEGNDHLNKPSTTNIPSTTHKEKAPHHPQIPKSTSLVTQGKTSSSPSIPTLTTSRWKRRKITLLCLHVPPGSTCTPSTI